MKFDLISDVHLDHHVMPHEGMVGVRKFVDTIVPDERADTLIIPGDLGHDNYQIRNLMVLLKGLYKTVIVTLGNHEFYIVGESKDNRVQQLKEFYKDMDVILLEGQTIEVDGMTIGGTHMWYDGSYAMTEHNYTYDEMYHLWKTTLNDYPLMNFDVFKSNKITIEKERLSAIYKECDIIVTHIPPLPAPNLREEFKNPVTGFFTFDGDRYFDSEKLKCWVYGHTHDQAYFYHKDVMCICNPLGYGFENTKRKIQGVEL